ncbi:MAG: type IV pilus biogenesis protein PilM, partial [Candidatus Omnitrophota bacterium]
MFKLHLGQKNGLKNAADKKPIVAVEIGNDWLKVIENVPSSGGWIINKMAFNKLAEIKGPVTETLSAIVQDLKLGAQPVITYIPRHLVTIRILRFPSTNPKEIEDMVSLQVGKQTPYSKQEIVSVYKVIDTEDDGYSRIMLVIVRHSLINERLDVLRNSGLEIDNVGISSEGVFNWFIQAYLKPNSKDKGNILSAGTGQVGIRPIILLDIDSNYSDFMVIHKQRMMFTRSILIGANHLLEDRDKWQDKFIGELRRSAELYKTEENGSAAEKMFLSGASGRIEGLDTVFSVKLGLPVLNTGTSGNVKIKNKASLEDEKFRPISVSPLIGLSLARRQPDIDLTPNELRIQRSTEEKRRHLTRMGILFIALIMSGSLSVLINIYNKSGYLARLKQNIARTEKKSDAVEKMRMRIELVKKRLDAKGTSLDIFYRIHKLTP